MREIKSINGLRVITVDEGASVGSVNQLVVDLSTGAVLGIILGNGASERGVLSADIQTIGSDVIMISSREVARHLSELPELEKRKGAASHLIPVFTDGGRRLGVVSGIYIDPLEKVVTRYEISSGAIKDLADGLLILPIISGTVHGADAIIIPDSAVREMGRESGGLFARFSQWSDSARKQYQQVAESAEKIVETGSETLKKEAAVMRENVADLSAKAKEAATKFGQKEDAAPETTPEAVPADEAIIAAPVDDPSVEQIVPVDEAISESDKPSCGCGCDSQDS